MTRSAASLKCSVEELQILASLHGHGVAARVFKLKIILTKRLKGERSTAA